MYTEHYLSLVSKFPVILKHSNHHGDWVSYFCRQSLRVAFLAYLLILNISVTLSQEQQVKNLPKEVSTTIPSTLSVHLGLSKENQCQGWQIIFFLSLT